MPEAEPTLASSDTPGRPPTPEVTVVIPSYNRAACLRDTIASLLAQTVRPAQIVVVDDGSTDDTAGVCRAFPPLVEYIRRANGGCPAARNTGIRAATGEYVAFVDADDVWEPTKLEVQLALHAARPEIGWSIANHVTTDQRGEPLPGVQGFARDLPAFGAAGLEPEAFFATDLTPFEFAAAGSRHRAFVGNPFELLFYGNFVLPSSAVLRREVIEEAGLFDEELRYAEETEFFHRVGARARLGVVMTPLVRWRRGQANTLISGRHVEPLIRNALVSLDRAIGLRPPTRRTVRLYTTARQRLLEELAYAQLSNLDPDAARITIRQAWAERVAPSLGALEIFAGSLVPRPALRALRSLKQRLRSTAATSR